jgi:Thiamine pyrophosphate-requiring enzymes [acetolactate synthase, pyruvate dehydrogenase (cytochrome), glyoxylate carboligase, phosphonopyruvate decarboxylase]
MADSIPMVIICGQVSRQAIGSDAFQEAPVTSVMGSVAKHVFLVTDENKLATTLKAAFEVAISGRPGPVVVDIPKDVQTAEISEEDYEDTNISAYSNRISTIEKSRLNEEKSSEFFTHLSNSKRPLIYFGGGVISASASKELREFVDYFNLPAVSTLMGLGAVDTRHPSSLHMLGMHGTPYANYAVQESDFLIAIGSRFDDRVAGVPEKFAPKAKVIAHFDVDPSEINKVKNAAWSHLGVLSLALKDLIKHAKSNDLEFNFGDWLSHTGELKSKYPLNFNRSSDLIQPEHVIECINKITKG